MHPLIQIATEKIGVKEDPIGSNCGTEVEEFLACVGLPPGQPWCMAFAYWCCVQAAELDPSFENKLSKTGETLHQLFLHPELVVQLPQPGDIGILDHGHGLGHTVMITKVLGGDVFTIEGNSNNNGSREGYEVATQQRSIATFKAFLRNPYNPPQNESIT